MKKFQSPIAGHLDIIVDQQEDEDESTGEKVSWQEVLIHGDPEGLRSLAAILLKMAHTDQEGIAGLPVGAREHTHLRPNIELAKSSVQVIIGRLDAKETGAFYDRPIPNGKKRRR